jgi:chemotaxis protein histidine kinase CheA
MSDFRQNFLAESIDRLTTLQKELGANFTENVRREAFRTIHTIKGGAQSLGLANAAQIAHELENLLSKSDLFNEQNLLTEGVALLKNSLGESEAAPDADFVEKLQAASRTKAKNDILLTQIPAQAFRKLSEPERNATVSALRAGKHIFCAEVGFEASNFADRYRNLRKVLTERSEIIASLPSEKHQSAGRIGFQIFIASREAIEDIRASVKDFDIEISSHACAEDGASDLFKMLSQIAAHAGEMAEKAGKEVRVSILANNIALSAGTIKALFEIVLQLVRNSVDHAIEQSGTVEIRLFEENESLHLSVTDDGRGIDLQKVRARAVAKNLISDDALLDEQETRALIFEHGLSTADRLTETSGRGVGLDSVKAAVEKLNGKISLRNRKTKGTVFEIFLPKEKL